MTWLYLKSENHIPFNLNCHNKWIYTKEKCIMYTVSAIQDFVVSQGCFSPNVDTCSVRSSYRSSCVLSLSRCSFGSNIDFAVESVSVHRQYTF